MGLHLEEAHGPGAHSDYDRVKDILCRFAVAIQEEEEKVYANEVSLQEPGGIAGGGTGDLGSSDLC